jgi:hypothetical protein
MFGFFWLFGGLVRGFYLVAGHDRFWPSETTPFHFDQVLSSFVSDHPAWGIGESFLVWNRTSAFQRCPPVLRVQDYGVCFAIAPALCQFYHAVWHLQEHEECPLHVDLTSYIRSHFSWRNLITYILLDSGADANEFF